MKWKYGKYIGIGLLSLLPACDNSGKIITGIVVDEEHPKGPGGVYKITFIDNPNRPPVSKPIIIDGSDPNSGFFGKADIEDRKIDKWHLIEYRVEERPDGFYPISSLRDHMYWRDKKSKKGP